MAKNDPKPAVRPAASVSAPKCPKCGSVNLSLSGKRWVGGLKVQQYICTDCGHRTINPVVAEPAAADLEEEKA